MKGFVVIIELKKRLTVKFLERELFRLTDEAEDHEPGNQVQASVEADCGDC